MKYLCLAYEAEETFKTMPREEWDAVTFGYRIECRPIMLPSVSKTSAIWP